MNWLAHLFLSEDNLENRLGNLLADLVKGSQRQILNPQVLRGIECHQFIDTFTDNHVVVKRSKQRISSNTRMRGILVDIIYDHFLAKNWSMYSKLPLSVFTAQIYQSFQGYQGNLPVGIRNVIARMAAEDWLGSYRSLAGVENALERISLRLSARLYKTFDMEMAVRELTMHYGDLEADFLEFFPQLSAHVKNWGTGNREQGIGNGEQGIGNRE
ncbi:MAG: ACP phosphodiesterase [Nostocaceae cyanobacterium]|nr:ACP phosphodiesterase [Nostocaceae cyanobacterium]